MRKIEVEVFEFSELKPEIQDRVINKFREDNDFPFLSDDLTEYCKAILEESNIEILRDFTVLYDLSCSQGSGFQFMGVFKWKDYTIHIKHSGHYYHEKCVDIDIINNEGDSVEDDKNFKELFESICNKCEKCGYDIIEAEQSEENIKENIKLNEYEFYENGRIV